MSVLVLSSIPSHINTHERLLVWAAMALQQAANGQTVNVYANSGASPTVQVQNAKTVDNVDRWILSAYIPCDYEELNSPTEKTWMSAMEITNSSPSPNMMAN